MSRPPPASSPWDMRPVAALQFALSHRTGGPSFVCSTGEQRDEAAAEKEMKALSGVIPILTHHSTTVWPTNSKPKLQNCQEHTEKNRVRWACGAAEDSRLAPERVISSWLSVVDRSFLFSPREKGWPGKDKQKRKSLTLYRRPKDIQTDFFSDSSPSQIGWGFGPFTMKQGSFPFICMHYESCFHLPSFRICYVSCQLFQLAPLAQSLRSHFSNPLGVSSTAKFWLERNNYYSCFFGTCFVNQSMINVKFSILSLETLVIAIESSAFGLWIK